MLYKSIVVHNQDHMSPLSPSTRVCRWYRSIHVLCVLQRLTPECLRLWSECLTDTRSLFSLRRDTHPNIRAKLQTWTENINPHSQIKHCSTLHSFYWPKSVQYVCLTLLLLISFHRPYSFKCDLFPWWSFTIYSMQLTTLLTLLRLAQFITY